MESEQGYPRKKLLAYLGKVDTSLSPLALKCSLESVGLDRTSNLYSIQEVKLIATVRYLAAVLGYGYDEIHRLYREHGIAIELEDMTSLEQVGDWLQQEMACRRSKQDLARLFDIELQAVNETLLACGLLSKTLLYDVDEIERFSLARRLIARLRLSYRQVSICFAKPTVLQSLLNLCEQNLYTKAELASEFNVSKDTVKKTLKHLGFSLSKVVYSEAERLRFQKARELIAVNVRYKDLNRKLSAICPDLDVDAYQEDDLWQFPSRH